MVSKKVVSIVVKSAIRGKNGAMRRRRWAGSAHRLRVPPKEELELVPMLDGPEENELLLLLPLQPPLLLRPKPELYLARREIQKTRNRGSDIRQAGRAAEGSSR